MSDTRRLALELHEIRQLALGHATNPQFGNSSVDGEGLSFRDSNGNEIGRIGGGENGMEVEYTYGPKPLMPSTPIVTADANLLLVQWDGQWAGGNEDGDAVADPDLDAQSGLDRVEVHVSMEPTFVPDPILSFAGVLPVTDEGGAHTVGPLAEAGDYYVVLMARGKDGQYSAPSQRVHVVTTVGLMENELFDLALRADEARQSADGKNTVHYGEEPVAPDGGFSEGDLWFDTTEDPETGFRKNTPHLWDPSANGGEGGWVSAADSRVDAIRDAQDALREDVERIVTDGAGATTYWLPEEPGETAEPTPKPGDIWFNTSDGNKLHRFDGQGWVPASDARFDTIRAAQDALEAGIATVRTSVDGKTAITQSTSTPPSQYGGAVGDRWKRMSSMGSGGSLISNWRWNGDVWVSTIISDAVLGNVDAAKIGTGYLDAARIEAGSIATDMLAVGVSGNLVYDPLFLDSAVSATRTNGTHWSWTTHNGETCFATTMPATKAHRDMQLTDPKGKLRYLPVSPGIKQVMEIDVDGPLSTYVSVRFANGGTNNPGGGVSNRLSFGRRVESYEIDASAYPQAGTGSPVSHFSVSFRLPNSTLVPSGTTTRVFGIRVSSVVGSTIIENGAVTTDKIAVGAITAESGIIGSIDAGKITVGELDGARIKAKSVLADSVLIDGSVGTTLIDGGAITTEKIAVGAITAESGLIGSLDAGVITTGELRGELIRAQSIAGESLAVDAIDGKTITGATVRTSSAGARVEMNSSGLFVKNSVGANTVSMTNGVLTMLGGTITGGTIRTHSSGARVQLDESGLKAWNPSNEETFSLLADTGSVHMNGNFYSRIDPADSRVVIDNEIVSDRITRDQPAGQYIESANAGMMVGDTDYNALFYTRIPDSGSNWSPGFRVIGPEERVKMRMDGHETTLGGFVVSSAPGIGQVGFAHMKVGGSGTTGAHFDTYVGSSGAFLGPQARIDMRGNDVRSSVDITAFDQATSGEQAQFRMRDGEVTSYASAQFTWTTPRIFWENIPNAHGGTEVSILANGSIGKTGSSRRYKIAEEPLERTQPDFYERLLGVQPKTWYDKAEAEYHADVAHSRTLGAGIDPDGISDGELRRGVGAIAEDLDEAGLGLLVSYNGDGSPESIMYSRVGIALIPVVRRLRDRVNELERMMGEMANA